MRILAVLIAILVTLANSSVCSAEPVKRGPYMSAFIGVTVPNDADVTSARYFPTPAFFNDKVEFDPGINSGLTGGYNFGYFRLEGELSYKGATISTVTDKFDNYRFYDVEGDVGVVAFLMNGFYDFRNSSPFTPYIGGGIGFGGIYINDTYGTNTRGGIVTRDLLYPADAAPVFAYQVGGGLEIALNSALSLDLSYRYLATSKAKFENDWNSHYYYDWNNGQTEFTFKSHNAAVGLRVKF